MSNAATNWKIGATQLNAVMEQAARLYRIAQLIKQAEDRHAEKIAYTRSFPCEAFPQLRAKTFREAAITLAAHERLVKYFNNIANEIQL